MAWQLIAIGGAGAVLGVAFWLASKNGSKSAQLEALKRELKKQAEEQRRAQQITGYVYALSPNDARRRLHKLANTKR